MTGNDQASFELGVAERRHQLDGHCGDRSCSPRQNEKAKSRKPPPLRLASLVEEHHGENRCEAPPKSELQRLAAICEKGPAKLGSDLSRLRLGDNLLRQVGEFGDASAQRMDDRRRNLGDIHKSPKDLLEFLLCFH